MSPLSMLKLLLITSDYLPSTGGVARYYSGLVDEFKGNAKVLTNVIGLDNQNVIHATWNWSIWPHWLPLLWLIPYYKLRLRVKYLAAGQLLPIGLALYLIKITFNWPYIIFVHGLDIQLTQHNSWKKWLARRILSQAKLVVSNSEFTKSLAVAAGALNQSTVVVYPCVSQSARVSVEQINDLCVKYNLVGKKIILTVARLVSRKGIGSVIQTIKELATEFTNMVYVVVGEGPEKGNLESQITDHKSNVLLVGKVGDDELATWYSLCDIFVLTPLTDPVDVEGFGIVYIEAQMAGKPVVGKQVGGVPEAVGECGILINTLTELTPVLRSLLRNKAECERLGELGKTRVQNEFVWNRQIKKLEEYLNY